MAKNQLEEVNLAPIGTLGDLKGLDLSTNQLKRVDLRPLKYCIEMKEIRLYENPLEENSEPDAPCSDLILKAPH
ncbi:MAG: hypothetical protein ACFFCR_00655 [Promethearchaeota archaeon]